MPVWSIHTRNVTRGCTLEQKNIKAQDKTPSLGLNVGVKSEIIDDSYSSV